MKENRKNTDARGGARSTRTFRSAGFLYGNQRSTMTSRGFGGGAPYRSITTRRGPGETCGRTFRITFDGIAAGGGGGRSRRT